MRSNECLRLRHEESLHRGAHAITWLNMLPTEIAAEMMVHELFRSLNLNSSSIFTLPPPNIMETTDMDINLQKAMSDLCIFQTWEATQRQRQLSLQRMKDQRFHVIAYELHIKDAKKIIDLGKQEFQDGESLVKGIGCTRLLVPKRFAGKFSNIFSDNDWYQYTGGVGRFVPLARSITQEID